MTLDSVLADLRSARADAASFPTVATALDTAIADVQAMLGGSSFPAWRQGLAVGVFTPITGSSLSAVVADSMAINDWSGLAAGDGQWYAVCNGGHTDSDSNAAYSIDFTADAPKWKVLRVKSNPTADAPTGYYPDGRPASRHTYNSPVFIKARNRVMLFGAAAIYRGSYTLQNVDGFRLADNDYDPAGTFAATTLSGSGLIACSWAKNPITEDVYGATSQYQVAKWTQATATWTLLPLPGWLNFLGGYKGLVMDAKRNRLVYGNRDTLTFLNLATNAKTTLQITGLSAEAAFPNQGALVHDYDADVYYAATSDGRVFSINPDTGAGVKIATLPAAGANGLQNRLAYLPSVKGLVYYPTFASQIYFMPTA